MLPPSASTSSVASRSRGFTTPKHIQEKAVTKSFWGFLLPAWWFGGGLGLPAWSFGFSVEVDSVVAWRSGLVAWRSGLVAWRSGLVALRSGLVAWRSGLVAWRSGLVAWRSGLVAWRSGLVAWRSGLVAWRSGLIRWWLIRWYRFLPICLLFSSGVVVVTA
uniref:Uncharacterized protein n=1 Tax=Fagus sylvatica TaxID=28930 RepID=A0A2N9HGN9_FAGSY